MLSRSSSTSNQRRSSILKPPKSRQPFQDLDFNASSPENSPDTIKKRRVSFAEKKHVKEFCDLKEQGTIWDNTYEEADQNVSKSIETSNEKRDADCPGIENYENVDNAVGEAGFDPIDSKTSVIMDSNRVEYSATKISLDFSADNELTYVTPCSRGILNEYMSRTVCCEDDPLDTTETVGGIEPTVSVRTVVGFESPCNIIRRVNKNIEKTMLFDDSDGDMKFTQVISGRDIETSTPVNSQNPKIEKIDSFTENRTIIFEDSIMDLTMPESNLIPGLDLIENIKTDDSKTPRDTENYVNGNLGNDYSGSDSRASQASDKTILFNDFGCDFTKPISSIIHRLPQPNSMKSNDLAESGKDLAFENNGRETCTDLSLKISDKSNCDLGNDYPENDSRALQGSNKTILFNDLGCDFTKPITSLIQRLPQLNSTKSNDLAESGKDLTSEKNGSDYNLGNDYPESDSRALQGSNKTILFNDSGCDFTKPVSSIIHRLPQPNSMRSNDPAESGKDLASKNNDKTIFFNDIGCEMTEAVDSLRLRLNRDESVAANKSDQIVPYQSPKINPLRDELMKLEASKSEIPSSSCKSDKTESPLISKAEDRNRTEFFNESGMDFTTAITRAKNHIPEQNSLATLSDSNIHGIRMNSESNFENRDEDLNTEMSFTKIVSSEQDGNDKERLSESLEDIKGKQCCDSLNDQNSECDIDLTEAVRPAALYSRNSEENLEDQNNSLNSVLSSTDLHGNKKRKSIESMEEIETSNKPSYSLLNKNPEQEYSLVQNLTHNETLNLKKNCKRSKLVDFNETANSEETENISDNLASISPLKSYETQEVQSAISADVTTANDRVTESTDEYQLHDENTSLNNASNCQENNERSTIKGTEELETESTGDIYAQEEPSFFGASCNEDEEILELSHVYKRQSISKIENNNELQSSLELSNNCPKNNDDCCFLMFKEGLEKFAKSDDCIWKIRSLDTEKVLIDFISSSIVVAIHLEADKELTAPHTIEDIKIVSLLSDSENGDIAMVHDILLRKLDPEKLKREHKTTQDILSLLEVISNRVKLLIDFMYELDKQKDFHLINRLGNRISFRLHSYKIQLVIKITIDIELFEDVGPNDVTVECILGNIREKDIKQLITSVKKDHKFLTNYINDIKEYIGLVLEK